MKFIKFPSLENSYRQKYINTAVEQGLTTGEFVVQEKVHGANLSLWTDGKNVVVASRNGFLDNPEKFYRSDLMLDWYESSVLAVFNDIKALDDSVTQVAVFGEIFGCSSLEGYPKPKYSQIQKGIYYTNDLDFYAFDVMVCNEESNSCSFLSVDEANELFHKYGFFHAETLFRGSFEEALEYPNDFNSKITEKMGIDTIKDNTCEGVVIRPVTPKFFLTNNTRFIIKNKNEKWSEKAKGKKVRVERKDSDIDDETAKIIDSELLPLINTNRLKNVLSKIGTVTDKDFGKVMKVFSNDALEDFFKDQEDLSKEQKKAITKTAGKRCADLLRENFLNIIDGTF